MDSVWKKEAISGFNTSFHKHFGQVSAMLITANITLHSLPPTGLAAGDQEVFRLYHQLYLWTHTIQWACGLGFLWLTVMTWRQADLSEQRQLEASPVP